MRLDEVLPFWLRALPMVLARRRPRPLFGGARPFLEQALGAGFSVLVDEPGRELVIGTIGQFWVLRGGQVVRVASLDEFVRFDHPHFAKAALNFLIEPRGPDRSRVRTETRVAATDMLARRQFGRYWRVIYPVSALIRRMWLRTIRRRAEAHRSPERVWRA